MPEFKSRHSYREFAFSVVRHWRFSRSEAEADFLATVLATSHGKEEALDEGTIFFRAQLGHDWRPEVLDEDTTEDMPYPFSPARMKPLQHRAVEGRANPRGIPYLYAATDQATAVAEVRPWMGALVSVAQLKTTRTLRILNFRSDGPWLLYKEEPPPEERERAVWKAIDRAFAQPVSPSDDVASYAPTQVLAEDFRRAGLDGIAYRSALGEGRNIALFDPDVAVVLNCGVVQITGVSIKSMLVANPYYVMEHYPPAPKAPVESDPP